ncbi:hypothetical protein [Candidatus Palauibacter sp.]|uniref:hypothetical protein n=1 Tax=Candidatus Palauibacter sp. TaxID=3101350 RepID=UPI003AF2E9D5
MSGGRRATLTVILVIAPLVSACSMLFMRRPPGAEGPVARGDCTRSVAAPVIDGLVGFGHLGQAAGIWGDSRDAFDTEEAYDEHRIGSAIIAGAFAVSGIHGFEWSGECRRRTTLSEQAVRDHLRVLAARQLGDQQKQPW